MIEPEWHNLRGIASERSFDRFIKSVGGARLTDRFPHIAGENADYIFEKQKVLIELKILETEFGDTAPFLAKEEQIARAMASKFGFGQLARGEAGPAKYYAERKAELYRSPLSRIAKKANRQIRATKAELGLEGYQGILLCVNDEFRKLSVGTVMSLFGRILNGSNSEIEAFVYLTNHYVDIPDDEYARILWSPMYADETRDHLPEFVNWLGREWFNFCDAEGVSSDSRLETPSIDLSGVRPILPLGD